jgi:hypothetical protein
MKKGRFGRGSVGTALLAVLVLTLAVPPVQRAQAADPPPQSGSIGLEGTISSAPPTRGATITVPSNGAVFSSLPITVSGLCPTGLLVKVFDNGVFVGSTVCQKGSYSLQVDLFSGRNDLVARVYDALDQAGPDSNTVTVTLNNAQFLQFGTPLSLTSPYAERGAAPGTQLEWPIILNGGVGPYALSIDWGDGTAADLMSVTTPGTVTIKHVYKTSGLYTVIIKATDKNGGQAFLQLVGQATGAVQNNKQGETTIVKKDMVWWPVISMVPLIFLSFWLGTRSNLVNIQRRFQEPE